MSFIEVKENESKVITYSDDMYALGTKNLDSDIAVTFYNKSNKKVALNRDFSKEALEKVVSEVKTDDNSIEVRLVGGDNSQKSKEKLQAIVSSLSAIDFGKDIFDVVSADINDKSHPNDFRITALDGMIDEI